MDSSIAAANYVIRRYANVHGVSVQRLDGRDEFKTMSNEKELVEHPGLYLLGYSAQKKKVFYVESFSDVIDYLPHEITHCAWPDSFRLTDGDDEWSCGMICYELAWLRRLCTTEKTRVWFKVWREYATQGIPSPFDVPKLWKRARAVTKKFDIPDPWKDCR